MYKNGGGGAIFMTQDHLVQCGNRGGGGYLQNFQKNHLIGIASHHLVLDAPRIERK